MSLRHYWWHDAITGTYYAVATDATGRITSAWLHVGGQWEALDYFGPLEGARGRGEMHVNDAPDAFTDELGPSLGPVQ